MLLYQNKVSAAFIDKVIKISKNLNVDPNWIMALINFESAGTFSPGITNKLGYTGLIQFGTSAAADLGTTTAKLRAMTAVEQLDWVEKYYKLWYKRLGIAKVDSFLDMYLVTFFPKAVNQPLDFIIKSTDVSPEKIAKANPIFDLNKDGKITLAEIERVMLQRLPTQWLDTLKKKVETT